MAGDADVRTATALLELMREPQARIAQVDEVCDFDGREYIQIHLHRIQSIEFGVVDIRIAETKEKDKVCYPTKIAALVHTNICRPCEPAKRGRPGPRSC